MRTSENGLKPGFFIWFRNLGIIGKTCIFLLVPILIFLTCLGISPRYKIKELYDLERSAPILKNTLDSLANSGELTPLIRKKAYNEALLKLSESDSINLVVNLHDSLVCLSIKGVIIHKTFVKLVNIDHLLEKAPDRVYAKLFSSPLEIIEETASIVKEPIVLRQAPKDTAEAALNAYLPDTLVQTPAFLLMKLEHGINLIFEQDSFPTFQDKLARLKFRSMIMKQNSIKNLNNFIRLKKLDYVPTLIIKMPIDDLRAIYRALPATAKVVLRYRGRNG